VRAVLLVLVGGLGCRINFDHAPTDAAGGSTSDTGDASEIPSAITVVQAAQAPSELMASSIQVALPTPPKLGNTVVAYYWSWVSGVSALDAGAATDSFGNGFQIASGRYTAMEACAAGMGGGSIFVAPIVNAVAGPYSVTVTPGGDTMQQLALAVVEYEGLSGDPVQDSASMESTGSSPLTFSSGTVVAEADTLIVALASECGGFPNPITWTSTFRVRGIESNTASLPPGIAGDRVVSSAGATSETWTVDYSGSGPHEAIGMIAALR
jgi:hypothetical protein